MKPLPRKRIPILIAGAGPVGLTLANLLGRSGVEVLLVEQNATLSDQPKAILLDDESFRTLQACGLADEIRRCVVYGYGARYYTGSGRCLAKVRPTATQYGFARRSAFNQPQLEQILLRGLSRYPSVTVRMRTKVIGLEQASDVAAVSLEDAQGRHLIEADWVVGCDGGRSTIRELSGVPMSGSSFSERWLILDTLEDPDDSRYTKFFCDPARPGVSVPAPQGGRRYEFMMHHHEDATALLSDESIQRLLAPRRALKPADIIRRTVYTFHALIADRFRIGRALLAGDAAHMMPPFAGQGMNTGIRDAHNLAWKLEMVVAGIAGSQLLDTYEVERRLHVQAMINLSVRLGRIVMPTSRIKAALRDFIFTGLGLIPPVNRYVTSMRWKPPPRYTRGLFLRLDGGKRFTGRMLVQPPVIAADGSSIALDDVLGTGWALLALDPLDPADLRHPLWERLNARRVQVLCDDRTPGTRLSGVAVGDLNDQLSGALRGHRGEILLVRPDRYVAGAFVPREEARFAEDFARLLGERVVDALERGSGGRSAWSATG